MTSDLNTNETTALKAFASSNEDNDRDFGFFDDACSYASGLTVSQMKGYASDLQAKGLIDCYVYDCNGDKLQAVDLTAAGWTVVDALTNLKF
jgi:hypothetical protein